jgi:hypothetical protein
MPEEQIFKKRFPEYCADAVCLSPYFDLFQIGFEEGEKQNEVKLDKAKELLKDWLQIAHKNHACCYGFVKDTEAFLKEVSE